MRLLLHKKTLFWIKFTAAGSCGFFANKAILINIMVNYNCDQCKDKAARRKRLLLHKKTLFWIKYTAAGSCGFFANKALLKNIMANYNCDQCKDKAAWRKRLQLHKKYSNWRLLYKVLWASWIPTIVINVNTQRPQERVYTCTSKQNMKVQGYIFLQL